MSAQAAAEKLRRGDVERFLSVMALRPDLREKLFILYAFNLEVARAPVLASDPMLGAIRLQWWHDALGERIQGKPPRRHEIAAPLSQMLSPSQAERLQCLVAARRLDLEVEPFASEEELWSYLYNTSGLLAEIAAEMVGVEDLRGVADVGAGLGLCNWLRAIPALIGAGHRPLPDGRSETVRRLAGEGLSKLRTATSPAATKVLLLRPIARTQLRRAQNDPSAVAEGRLEVSPARLRAMLIWASLRASL